MIVYFELYIHTISLILCYIAKKERVNVNQNRNCIDVVSDLNHLVIRILKVEYIQFAMLKLLIKYLAFIQLAHIEISFYFTDLYSCYSAFHISSSKLEGRKKMTSNMSAMKKKNVMEEYMVRFVFCYWCYIVYVCMYIYKCK